MSHALLDVNVLVALFDPAHVNHEDAHAWFSKNHRHGWATCPLTINGCVRVLSNPAYPTVDATPAEVISHLTTLCSSEHHESWPADISLLDTRLFRPGRFTGHQMLTDAYLLALAVHYQGTLVTFDRSAPVNTVVGATSAHVKLLPA